MKYKLIGVVLWTAVLGALYLVYQDRQSKLAASDSDLGMTPSNVSIPAPAMALAEFDLVNTQGEKVTRDDVLGKPAVFAFVFSRCTSTCPPIMMRTKELHDKLGDADVRFFTVTIDPEFDTVKHFAKFADTYSPDPERWQFLTGSKETIHDMISNGFRQVVAEVFGEDRKPGAEFTHTNRVVLVNADGIPVKTYLILNDGDRAKLLRVLQGKAPFPQPATGDEAVTLTRGDGTTENLSAGP